MAFGLLSLAFVLFGQEEVRHDPRRAQLGALGIVAQNPPTQFGVKGRADRKPAQARYGGRVFVLGQCIGPDGRFYLANNPQYRACVDGEINDLDAQPEQSRFVQGGILIMP